MPAHWDVERGRRLYAEGLSRTEIAERCATTPAAVAHHINRHWGAKPRSVSYGAVWNTELGRTLWDKGLTPNAIAKQCGTTKNAVVGYSKRHWPARHGDAERQPLNFQNGAPKSPSVPKARPLRPGERTLPDLPSLVGYY
jgi:hypothetical protein